MTDEQIIEAMAQAHASEICCFSGENAMRLCLLNPNECNCTIGSRAAFVVCAKVIREQGARIAGAVWIDAGSLTGRGAVEHVARAIRAQEPSK